MYRPAALLVLLIVAACRNIDVITENYATLAEAHAAGAADRGWLPKGLPAGTAEIRIAHDLDSNRRWGLFNFPPAENATLRAILDKDMPLGGQKCNPPGRIEWWPVLLRGNLDQARIATTGLQAYSARESGLIVAVNWNQGRAYYWTSE